MANRSCAEAAASAALYEWDEKTTTHLAAHASETAAEGHISNPRVILGRIAQDTGTVLQTELLTTARWKRDWALVGSGAEHIALEFRVQVRMRAWLWWQWPQWSRDLASL